MKRRLDSSILSSELCKLRHTIPRPRVVVAVVVVFTLNRSFYSNDISSTPSVCPDSSSSYGHKFCGHRLKQRKIKQNNGELIEVDYAYGKSNANVPDTRAQQTRLPRITRNCECSTVTVHASSRLRTRIPGT